MAIDGACRAPTPAPVTTIAWRLTHVIVGCLIHHGAEISLLRDLWAHREPP
jgi:hypothetical protein